MCGSTQGYIFQHFFGVGVHCSRQQCNGETVCCRKNFVKNILSGLKSLMTQLQFSCHLPLMMWQRLYWSRSRTSSSRQGQSGQGVSAGSGVENSSFSVLWLFLSRFNSPTPLITLCDNTGQRFRCVFVFNSPKPRKIIKYTQCLLFLLEKLKFY